MGNLIQGEKTKYDPDELFAYDTVREVKVKDRRLGYVYYFFLLTIVFYIVIWVFLVKQMYLAREKTTGWTTTKLLYHSVEDPLRVFDVFESVTNDGEQGAIFVPTRVVITRGQVQEGFCESPNDLCATPEDCDIGDDSLQQPLCQNGRCLRRHWCPAMEVGTPKTETHYVNTDAFDIWFATNIHFHLFALDVGTTDEEESERYPGSVGGTKTVNTYPVHDLLRMANVDISLAKETGVIINVNKVFNCDLDANVCHMELDSSAVVGEDKAHSGFNYGKQHFYTEGGVTKRDLYQYYGVRVYSGATGIGKKTSFANIVLQLSSAIALLTTATAAADVFLQYIIAEREHYKALKIINSEDFNKETTRPS